MRHVCGLLIFLGVGGNELKWLVKKRRKCKKFISYIVSVEGILTFCVLKKSAPWRYFSTHERVHFNLFTLNKLISDYRFFF